MYIYCAILVLIAYFPSLSTHFFIFLFNTQFVVNHSLYHRCDPGACLPGIAMAVGWIFSCGLLIS